MRKAFTLIELIVVIAIIGILSAIAGIAYSSFVSASHDSAAKTNSAQVVRTGEIVAVVDGFNAATFINATSKLRQGNTVFTVADESTTPTELSIVVADDAVAIALVSRSGSCVFTFGLQGSGIVEQLVATGTATGFVVESTVVACSANAAPKVLMEVAEPQTQLAVVESRFNSLFTPEPVGPVPVTLCKQEVDGTYTEVTVIYNDVASYLSLGYVEGVCPAPVNPFERPAEEQALFTAGALNTANSFTLLGEGASIYAGGGLSCANSTNISAVVITPGGANITNSCSLTGLWAGGNVRITTGGPSIPGGVSAVGNIAVTNGPLPLGPLTAGGSVTGNTGSSEVTENADVPTPPNFSFPVLGYDEDDYTGWNSITWEEWVNEQRDLNGAKGTLSNPCSINGTRFSMNGGLNSPSEPTVVDSRACSTVTWTGISGADQLTLNNDLTILVNDLTNTNGLEVVADNPVTLRIISPHTGLGECGSTSGGSVKFNSGGFDLTAGGNVSTLIYAPNRVTISNNSTITGQVFSCSASISNNFTLNYVPVTFTP